MHILQTRMSLEQKGIFESSIQHFSSHVDYLFMFLNGLDRKDAIYECNKHQRRIVLGKSFARIGSA